MEAARLEINVSTNAARANAQLAGTDKALKNVGGNAKVASGALSGLRGIIAGGAFATIGITAFKAAAGIEQQSIAFRTLVGDAGKASKLLEDIQKFTASTPFQFDEVASAGKSLLAFGEAADNIVPALRRIGDISSGVGARVGDIAEIYGKARVQGTLFAEDINQLTGRGIPVIQEFAKQLGVSESQVKKLGSEGKITFDNLEQAFKDLTGEGGKFAGLTEAQSQSLSGVISTLKDNVTLLLVEAVTPLVPQIKELAITFSNWSNNIRETDGEAIKNIITFAKWAGGVVILTAAFVKARAAAMALKLAFVGNPVGLALVAASTAAAAFLAYQEKSSREARELLESKKKNAEKAKQLEKIEQSASEIYGKQNKLVKEQLKVLEEINLKGREFLDPLEKQRAVGEELLKRYKENKETLLTQQEIEKVTNEVRQETLDKLEKSLSVQEANKKVEQEVEKALKKRNSELQKALGKYVEIENKVRAANGLQLLSIGSEEKIAKKAALTADQIKKNTEAAKKWQQQFSSILHVANDIGKSGTEKNIEKTNSQLSFLESTLTRLKQIQPFRDVSVSINLTKDAIFKLSASLENLKILEIAEKIKAGFDLVGNAISNIAGSIGQIYQNQSNAQIQAIDEQLAADKKRVNETITNEDQRQQALAKLDDEAALRKKRIEREAAIRQRDIAIFQATVAGAQGLLNAVVSGIQAGPYAAPFVIAGLTSLVAATTAAQIAAIASTPIPSAQFGGSFVVPPGNAADSGLLRVNQGERVDVSPVSQSGSQNRNTTITIDGKQFRGYISETINGILNSGNVRIKRSGVVTA